jgi:hypothetical protein
MLLRQQNQDLIQVEIDENEDDFIEINPDYIKVSDLPFSISGYYLYSNGEIIVNQDKELEALKLQRMDEVQNKFNDLMFYGTFETSLGFVSDNRRGDGKDDKDNVQSLIELGQEPVYFKDADNNFHALTQEDLITLKQEMIQDGLGKYQWKWNKETEIMNCTSTDELLGVDV